MFTSVINNVFSAFFGKKTIKEQDPTRLLAELKVAVVLREEAKTYLVYRNLFDNNYERCLAVLPQEAMKMKEKRFSRAKKEVLAELFHGYCKIQRKMNVSKIQLLLDDLLIQVNQKLVQKAKKRLALEEIQTIATTKSHQRQLLHTCLTTELANAILTMTTRKQIRIQKEAVFRELVGVVERRHLEIYRIQIANQFQDVMKEIESLPKPQPFKSLPKAPSSLLTSSLFHDPMILVFFFNFFAWLIAFFQFYFVVTRVIRNLSTLYKKLDSVLLSSSPTVTKKVPRAEKRRQMRMDKKKMKRRV